MSGAITRRRALATIGGALVATATLSPGITVPPLPLGRVVEADEIKDPSSRLAAMFFVSHRRLYVYHHRGLIERATAIDWAQGRAARGELFVTKFIGDDDEAA